jgi:trimeric autotransporter adhesin
MSTCKRWQIIAVVAITAAVFVLIGCNKKSSSTILPVGGGGSTAYWGSWITDGSVYGIATSGNTIYFVGNFNNVWANSGSGAAVDTSTGMIVAKGKVLYVTGAVNAVASDGKGGWYIGGSITKVGNSARDLLAHIKSDGSLDENWSFAISGTLKVINKIVASGDSIYVGGKFTQITDAVATYSRTHLARLKSDGTVDPAWFPTPTGTGAAVNALALSGSTLYVGGKFTSIGGLTQNHLAGVSTSTGAGISGWDPGLSSGNEVYAVAVSGSTVYVGGSFSTIGTQSRNYMAGLNVSDAHANSFDPNPILPVTDIAVSKDGNTVFAAGLFFGFSGTVVSIGGVSRDYLAALDASNGTGIGSWNPAPDGPVNSMAISGDTLYVGGNISTIGGSSRKYAAALATDTSAVTVRDWAPTTETTVNAVAVSGSKAYVGGSFTGINLTVRNMAAAVDGSTGRLTSWDPNVNGNAVWAVAVNNSTVYLGGDYSQVGSTSCLNLAGVSSDGTTVSKFTPSPDDVVYALKASSGNLYVGGQFTNYLNAYDLDTMQPLVGWTSPILDDNVYALEASGSVLYAGGHFTGVGSDTNYQLLAAFSPITGALTQIRGFDFDPMYTTGSGTVYSLDLSNGSLYTGGTYNGDVGGFPKHYLADIDVSNLPGITTSSWNPTPNGTVYAFSLLGSTLYTGGTFNTVNSITMSVAAIDIKTGAVSNTWNPTLNYHVRALKAFNNVVLVGGGFDTMNGSLPFWSLVAIDRETGLPWGY